MRPLAQGHAMSPRFIRITKLLGHQGARHLLIAGGLVIGLMLGVGTAWLIVASRQDDIRDSARELSNLSYILAEETDRAFQSMQLVQIGLADRVRELGIDTPGKFDQELASPVAHQELQHRIAGLPHISFVAVTSVEGFVINSSRDLVGQRLDVAKRDYFQAFSHDPTLVSFIGGPVQNYTNGEWTILFARVVVGPDGKRIGIVSVGVQLDLFEHLFASITVADDASFSLFRADGILMARYPRIEAILGRSLGTDENIRHLRESLDRAIIRPASVIDGKARVIATHTVAHYPLMVSATNTVAAALVFWRERTFWIAGVATLAELVLAGIVLLGVRLLRGQEILVAASEAAMQSETARVLAESELALARQRETAEREARMVSQRFDVALSNMAQGLLMFDGAGRLLIANRRFIELFGLPADAVPMATTYGELGSLIDGCGSLTPDDLANLRNWRENLLASRVRAAFTWELSDGRALTVTHQPMTDGWLATYEDITESRRADSRMAHMARHDALTDLPNRVLFHEKLQEALAHARRGHSLALLCLDLDQFKAVNDTLGHPVGDALLQAVARRLLEQTRDTDTVARLGGDEFAVVQSPIDNPAAAVAFADRLIAMLDEPFEVQGHQIVIATSIGIAFAPQDGLDANDLLKSADLALYRAKTEGRGIYRLFQTEMDAQMQARRLLELDLRNALRCGQMEVFYQPLIDLRARAVAGFEALLRWRHPVKGLIPPAQFIPLAEEIGAIVTIGEWVLRRACTVATSWPFGMKVAVNLSPVQFKSRNLVATVAGALQDSGLSPERLELEITETIMLQDTAATLATLHELRALGVHIAMDDFGTGYSSLSYLRRFPFDRIKIDQSFVRELGEQRDSSAIVRAVTALSHELGMATTAEGVETQEQLAMLTIAGCTDVQGYLFSPPVPEAEVARLLRSLATLGDTLPNGTVTASGRSSAQHELLPAQ